MRNTLVNILYLLVGVGLGYLLFYLNRCDDRTRTPVVETNTIIDTVVHTVEVEVPKYRTKYVTRTDSIYQTVFDSIEKWSYIIIPDTIPIEINQYRDSIETKDYRFDYTIETLGNLLYFDPKFTVYEKRPLIVQRLKPKWMISGAVSQKANLKLGIGFKGVVIEGVFHPKFRELYIGKQFIF